MALPNKKQEPKKKKQYYIIKVDGVVATEMTFKVLAEDEDDAFNIYQTSPSSVYFLGMSKVSPSKVIKKKVSIRAELSNLIKWMRNF